MNVDNYSHYLHENVKSENLSSKILFSVVVIETHAIGISRQHCNSLSLILQYTSK